MKKNNGRVSNYRLVVRPVQIAKGLKQKNVAVISLRNNITGVEAVHPITEFIFHNWRDQRYLTMRRHAMCIACFLNYIFFDNQFFYKIKALEEIEIFHVSDYLNNLGENNCREDVLFQRNTLTGFLLYLSKKGFLPRINDSMFEVDMHGAVVCNFEELILPSTRSCKVIHHFDSKLVLPFIAIARRKTPRIAFGVYLQIFGGCRIGEVVNLRRVDFSPIGDEWGSHGLLLKLEDRNLRPDAIRSGGTIGVKKPREQVVFAYKDWLETLWKFHIQHYSSENRLGPLFVNRRGRAMTKKNYTYEFEKLKTYFIDWLKTQGTELSIYAHFLASQRWSTHIGRGLFSSLIAKDAKNLLDIAVPRGDIDLTAAIRYLALSPQIMERLEGSLQLLHEDMLHLEKAGE